MSLLVGVTSLLALLSTSVDAAATFKVNLYQGTENCNAVGLVDVAEGPFVADAVACFAYGGNSFWVVDSGKWPPILTPIFPAQKIVNHLRDGQPKDVHIFLSQSDKNMSD